MSMKISFDSSNNPEMPTFVLATRNGTKLGQIPSKSLVCSDALKEASEFSFKVYKCDCDNNKEYDIWDKIKDFKLVWCKDWDIWFSITVEIDESTQTVKTVYGTRLGQAETSQIMLYDIEINTETDISRDDYDEPTVLWNTENTKASLLHRIMEKAPHYKIIHVDTTIANIQRIFSFDSKSIHDAFQEIEKEIGCLFEFPSNSDENGNIQRTIAVYDIQSNCHECGHRGEYTGKCPKCGSENIDEGYGEDTTIFITSDELGEDIQFSTDTGSVKNCFKLEAGDDLMTATIRNCNPNGSDYIWYIPEYTMEDVSNELTKKLKEYNSRYDYYQNDYESSVNDTLLSWYNDLINRYRQYNSELVFLPTIIRGYPELMNVIYNVIDTLVYLESSMMPDVNLNKTSAVEQVESLIEKIKEKTVAVEDLNNISEATIATANSVVLSVAKSIVNSNYQVKISDSFMTDNQTWKGKFAITNYSDENDSESSDFISIVINDNYETYVKQKLEKALHKEDSDDVSITGLFEKDQEEFVLELKKYGLNSLIIFHDACQSCIDILIEQGISDNETWSGSDPNLYKDLYLLYYDKLGAIESELKIRQDDIELISGRYDSSGRLIWTGVRNFLESIRDSIQEDLNFQNFLGSDLWLEFCSYRREDKYSNENYISDGLSNAELFKNAFEFIETASNEIYKSAELQHSIACKLRNLLAIKKFLPLVKYFKVGNWIRVQVDSVIYKLRLIKYQIDFDNLDSLSVDFSDVTKTANGETDQIDLMQQVSSMTSTYETTKHQASQGANSSFMVKGWFENGLDVTSTKIIGGADNQVQTWDNHGMLFRKYDDITDSYKPEQLKIINSSIAVTDDNWESTKTAIGYYYYFDPVTQKLKSTYGINGETIIGKLILGESLGIYSSNGSMTFNDDGLKITNGTNTFTVDPNDEKLLSLTTKSGSTERDILYIDDNGILRLNGSVGIYDRNGQILVELDYRGVNYYADGHYVGQIGTDRYALRPDETGLLFTLGAESDYMSWVDQSESGMKTKLMYHRRTSSVDEGFYFYSDIYIGNSGSLSAMADNLISLNGSGANICCGNRKVILNPSESVECNGNLDMMNYNILNQSDERLKTNINDTHVNALDILNQIKLKKFDWIDDNTHENIGIIAQQLRDILPELVYEDSDTGILSIKTTKFIPYLIKAVQELYKMAV